VKTNLLGVLALLAGCAGLPSSAASKKHDSSELTVTVSGDVQAALVDLRGRRTGWYGGWVEDIPNCRLEAIRDEVAEPQNYSFHFEVVRSQRYELLLTPRTQGEVSIGIEGTLAGVRACSAKADTELVEGESKWLLEWSSNGKKCRASITTPQRPKR